MRKIDFLWYVRKLRKNQTPAESLLWERLRAHRFFGVKFKRQVQIGPYVVDFCSTQKRLVIEIDGSVHNERGVKKRDKIKDDFLRHEGYRVVRFWNSEVEKDLPNVLEKLRLVIS